MHTEKGKKTLWYRHLKIGSILWILNVDKVDKIVQGKI